MGKGTDNLANIFPGDSEMARLMRQRDWAATPLGDPAGWPDALKIPLKMLLSSRFEMWLGWGPELAFFYNDSYIPTLGRKHPAALGKPFREVWAEVYDDIADQVDRVRAGEATWNKALLLLLERNGYPEETYHSFSYSPLCNANDAVEGLLCVVSEDTERVISERRIDMLRQLGMKMVGMTDQRAVIDAAFAVLDFSRRDFPFALLFLHNDIRTASADARHLLDHSWPIDRSAGAPARKLSLPTNLPVPTGPWKIAPKEALLVPIPGAGGQPFGSLLLGLNPHRPEDPYITDIARLMAGQIGSALTNVTTLQSERRRANQVWSFSRDLLVVIGSDGILRAANPAWTRILGHPIERILGRHFRDFIFADDLPRTAEAFARAAGNGELTAFENRLVGADGKSRWFSWHTSAERDTVYGYGRDITQQKENAAALAATEAALRQAQKMEAVGQLTGGIAHDFNNLLTGIIGSLEMMKRRLGESRLADVDRYATAASSAAHRAAALTQRLLAFSRRQPLDPKIVDLNVLVGDMADLIRRSIGESIELELPVSTDISCANCDANQLESALLNLAINARDAMPGGGRLTIKTANVYVDADHADRARIAAPGDFVMISVADNGHGMPADVQDKAFEPFFTTKPTGQGTGLGLSMIYGFLRQSGGFVELTSEEGKGTTVRLYLPRCERQAPQSDGVTVAPSLNRAETSETILVVEDETTVRTIVVEALRDLGYKTLVAGDGAAGLKFIEAPGRIDLLLSDVGLPGGLNGRQLADAARVTRPDLRVLFMTAYAHNAEASAGALAPGMELISKPFEVDALVQRVQRMIAPAL